MNAAEACEACEAQPVEYPLTPDQEARTVALALARDLLLVKAGQFAERPIDPAHLIEVADWILGLPAQLPCVICRGVL